MQKITTITYLEETYDVFHVSRRVCPITSDEENAIACSSLANRIIYVFDEFNKLSEDSRHIVLLHEVAHLNGIMGNVEADIFVLRTTTMKKFIAALYEIRNILFKAKPTKHIEIADIINSRIDNVKKDIG